MTESGAGGKEDKIVLTNNTFAPPPLEVYSPKCMPCEITISPILYIWFFVLSVPPMRTLGSQMYDCSNSVGYYIYLKLGCCGSFPDFVCTCLMAGRYQCVSQQLLTPYPGNPVNLPEYLRICHRWQRSHVALSHTVLATNWLRRDKSDSLALRRPVSLKA